MYRHHVKTQLSLLDLRHDSELVADLLKYNEIKDRRAKGMSETRRSAPVLQRNPVKVCMLVLCVIAIALNFGCRRLKARDEMNKGVEAYRNNRYEDAANHFKQALSRDPENIEAKLYLATTYLVQWVPGKNSPENRRDYEAARTAFQEVLRKDPKSKVALASLGSMAYQSALNAPPDQKRAALEEARKWNLRRIEVDPKDAEAYYYLGVIAWNETYFPIQDIRTQLKMSKTQPAPLKNPEVRGRAREQYGKTVDEGIAALRNAIDLNKHYEDAMSYLNLLLRVKADLEDSNDAARQDIEEANYWANQALEVKKKKEQPQKKQASQIRPEDVFSALRIPEPI
jgi:tetratricopeptide (TPR) repeat protein